MNKPRFNTIYLMIALFGVILVQNIWRTYKNVDYVPYSEFQQLLNDGQIEEVVVSEERLQGKLIKARESGKKEFSTNRVDKEIIEQLQARNVKYSQIIENTWLTNVLSWILPAVFFVGIWMYAMKRMAGKGGVGGGFMAVGKSKAKVYVETDTKTTFKDVAGVDEAKAELVEVVDFLKNAERYSRLGGRMPKGILLVGPPGTGKTLIARAVAGEAGVTFFSISGSEFVEMFVGVGAARVRDLFEQARQKAPCIIFIDELDALGRSRAPGGFQSGGHDEKEQTLNQLLVELDGFDSSSGIVLLGATNRPEILDPALLRAGRFDRQVLLDKPDKKGRLQILQVHVKKIILAEDTELEKVAGLTPGFTGADLENLVNEAALAATRRDAKSVELNDFTTAMERIVAGLERKNRLLNEFERKVVAHHEMGHALVARSLKGCDPIHKVSIIPRGIGSLGYTIQRPTEDRFLMTKEELENKISVLLGGRAAERLIFGHLSTGAADDMVKATDIARSMITQYGMDETLGQVSYEKQNSMFLAPGSYSSQSYSSETAREIDTSIKDLVEKCYNRAGDILKKNEELLKESATTLLAKETLTENELEPLFEKIQS